MKQIGSRRFEDGKTPIILFRFDRKILFFDSNEISKNFLVLNVITMKSSVIILGRTLFDRYGTVLHNRIDDLIFYRQNNYFEFKMFESK